jgi:quercetin 2,3-dioxygenase
MEEESKNTMNFRIRPKNSDYDEMINQVNELKNTGLNKQDMNTIYHPANNRGYANHGWLEANHSFSFASFYDPERVNFGALRVLNDDKIAGGMGFGTHPHDNMEIITIPLEGDLAHKDSMGNGTTIKSGDIQVMSAGTGILHSEFNANENQECKLLQIWIFPRIRGVEPRYQQITLDASKTKNDFLQIVSPNQEDDGVWIHQDAWFHIGEFDENFKTSYQFKNKSTGLYVFIIEGKIEIEGQILNKRDGFGIWNIEKMNINVIEKAKILLMEVPMTIK